MCIVELDVHTGAVVEELQSSAEAFFARDEAAKAEYTGYAVGTGKQMYHHSPDSEQPRDLADGLSTAHSALQGAARVLLQALCRSQVRAVWHIGHVYDAPHRANEGVTVG